METTNPGATTRHLRDADRHPLPESWARGGGSRVSDADGDWFYAIEISVEYYERHQEVSAREVSISEDLLLYVRYATADGDRAIQDWFTGSTVEQDGGMIVIPRAVRNGTPEEFITQHKTTLDHPLSVEAPSKPDDAARVRERYDIDD